jgi:hypothetical protein
MACPPDQSKRSSQTAILLGFLRKLEDWVKDGAYFENNHQKEEVLRAILSGISYFEKLRKGRNLPNLKLSPRSPEVLFQETVLIVDADHRVAQMPIFHHECAVSAPFEGSGFLVLNALQLLCLCDQLVFVQCLCQPDAETKQVGFRLLGYFFKCWILPSIAPESKAQRDSEFGLDSQFVFPANRRVRAFITELNTTQFETHNIESHSSSLAYC